MAVIDSNNFITHLVWSGLIDKATCGELKEAIELCTVKDIYTKADLVAMLTDIQSEIRHFMYDVNPNSSESDYACNYMIDIIQDKINSLKAEVGKK